MSEKTPRALSLFLDTNVWLDYYLDRGLRHDAAGKLVARANELDVDLYTALTSLKDVYYVVHAELKRIVRSEGNEVTAQDVAAADEIAWSCVRGILAYSTVVPAGTGDVWEAFLLRAVHHDFEDDLVLAVAKKCRAGVLVTEDAALRAHAPLPAVDIEGALALLEGVRA